MRYFLRRILWMVPTLFGITFLTFAMMDLAPLDRARIDLLASEGGFSRSAEARQHALRQLEIHYGLVDEETHQPLPLATRYLRWLGAAATLQLAGPGEDPAAFRRRLGGALPVTVLINSLAVLLALIVSLWLGTRMGMAPGGALDRVGNGILFTLYGVPDFVLASGCVVLFGGAALFEWIPVAGLRSDASGNWPLWRQLLDLLHHLLGPVLTLAVGPAVVLTRFIRESVARASQEDFALNLEAWGLPPRVVRRRVLRNGLSPLVTQAGTLLPLLVGGSVVVESVFSVPGVGRLAWRAVLEQDQGMVMALTLLSSILTLTGMMLSDLAHRAVDPRVQLR